MGFFDDLGKKVGKFASSVEHKVEEVVKTGYKDAKGAVSTVYNDVKGTVKDTSSTIKDAVKSESALVGRTVDVAGSTLSSLGQSLCLPLLLIGGAALAFVLLSRK